MIPRAESVPWAETLRRVTASLDAVRKREVAKERREAPARRMQQRRWERTLRRRRRLAREVRRLLLAFLRNRKVRELRALVRERTGLGPYFPLLSESFGFGRSFPWYGEIRDRALWQHRWDEDRLASLCTVARLEWARRRLQDPDRLIDELVRVLSRWKGD